MPRGELDQLAVQMLENTSLQVAAQGYRNRNPKVRIASRRHDFITYEHYTISFQYLKKLKACVNSTFHHERGGAKDPDLQVDHLYDADYDQRDHAALDKDLADQNGVPLVADAMSNMPKVDDDKFSRKADDVDKVRCLSPK